MPPLSDLRVPECMIYRQRCQFHCQLGSQVENSNHLFLALSKFLHACKCPLLCWLHAVRQIKPLNTPCLYNQIVPYLVLQSSKDLSNGVRPASSSIWSFLLPSFSCRLWIAFLAPVALRSWLRTNLANSGKSWMQQRRWSIDVDCKCTWRGRTSASKVQMVAPFFASHAAAKWVCCDLTAAVAHQS